MWELTANDLIRALEDLSPEKKELPLFAYSSKYGMWFPLTILDLDLEKDVIWHHINNKGDLYEWSDSSFDKDDVLVECLKLL
jgi:hypothetical protein